MSKVKLTPLKAFAEQNGVSRQGLYWHKGFVELPLYALIDGAYIPINEKKAFIVEKSEKST